VTNSPVQNITSQLLCLRSFLCSNKSVTTLQQSINDLTAFLIKQDLASTFHDVLKLCLIFVTILVTSAECSFYKLKLIKNYLRNSNSQDRLTNISILNIERDQTSKLNVDK